MAVETLFAHSARTTPPPRRATPGEPAPRLAMLPRRHILLHTPCCCCRRRLCYTVMRGAQTPPVLYSLCAALLPALHTPCCYCCWRRQLLPCLAPPPVLNSLLLPQLVLYSCARRSLLAELYSCAQRGVLPAAPPVLYSCARRTLLAVL